jgi:hypothetical protein
MRLRRGVAVRKADLATIIAALFVAASAFSVGVHALSAAPLQGTAPRTPRPAHERLAVLEGTWTKKDLPAGESFRDTCAWLPEGRRHMICRQRAESPRGTSEQMAIFSYRGADSTYLLTVLLANGQVWRYEGRPDADRWTFELVSSRSGSTRLRQVLIPTGDTIAFLEEVSEDGGPWRLSDPSEDFTYVRVREGR